LPKLPIPPGTPDMVKKSKTIARNPYRNEFNVGSVMDLLREGLGPFARKILKMPQSPKKQV
jgi:hypothetical protein